MSDSVPPVFTHGDWEYRRRLRRRRRLIGGAWTAGLFLFITAVFSLAIALMAEGVVGQKLWLWLNGYPTSPQMGTMPVRDLPAGESASIHVDPGEPCEGSSSTAVTPTYPG